MASGLRAFAAMSDTVDLTERANFNFGSISGAGLDTAYMFSAALSDVALVRRSGCWVLSEPR